MPAHLAANCELHLRRPKYRCANLAEWLAFLSRSFGIMAALGYYIGAVRSAFKFMPAEPTASCKGLVPRSLRLSGSNRSDDDDGESNIAAIASSRLAANIACSRQQCRTN